jgi:cysteine desulfurase
MHGYFDWNATAPRSAAALAALERGHRLYWANASTPYRSGSAARAALEEAREALAAMVNWEAERVVFTGGATEANHLLMAAYARRYPDGKVALTGVEHPSLMAAVERWFGAERMVLVDVGDGGLVDVAEFEQHVKDGAVVLCCLLAMQNETGVLQPVEQLSRLCSANGVALHCDASQWFGKFAPSSCFAGCSSVVLSGHKFGAPLGVGAALLGGHYDAGPLIGGGGQENGWRGGTQAVPSILALVAALSEAQDGIAGLDQGVLAEPKLAFERRLRQHFSNGLEIHGCAAPRAWNTCSVALPDFASQRWIAQLDRRGFAVSSGAACSTGREGPSAVLRACGVSEAVTRRTLRISSGWTTPASAWQELYDAVIAVHGQLQAEARKEQLVDIIDLEGLE